MKKTLVSLLFSAAAMPMLQAEASQMEAVSMDSMRVETGTFGVEVDEPLISGSYSDMQNKPAAELNTEAIYVPNKAVVIDGKAYMFMEVAGDTEDYSKVIIFMLMMKMGRMYILQATAHMMECGLSGFSWIP